MRKIVLISSTIYSVFWIVAGWVSIYTRPNFFSDWLYSFSSEGWFNVTLFVSMICVIGSGILCLADIVEFRSTSKTVKTYTYKR